MTLDEASARLLETYLRLTFEAEHVQHLSAQFLERLGEEYNQRRREVTVRYQMARTAAMSDSQALIDAASAAHATTVGDMAARMEAATQRYPWLLSDWSDPTWNSFVPATSSPSRTEVRVGLIDLPSLEGLPPIPAVIDIAVGHLLVFASEKALPAANDLIQAIAVRAVCGTPPGSHRIGLIDPTGKGQQLSAFLRLPSAIRLGERVATSPGEIEVVSATLLADIVEITQTRLTNVYDSVEEYNDGTTGLAVPYRLVLASNVPAGFTDRTAELLLEIARTGQRCGVHLIATVNSSAPLPKNLDLDELSALSTTIHLRSAHKATWSDERFSAHGLIPDRAPDPICANVWLDAVGHVASSSRGALPFSRIAIPSGERWQGMSLDGLRVQIGVDARGDTQEFVLGTGAVQHGLIGGDTQMGKTNLLHVILTQLALRYPPEELELYLLDFKEVEFERYLSAALPHARAIASRTDREFGLSVLRRFRQEIDRRTELFRSAGVTHIVDYRRQATDPLPRALVVMDEFQVLFRDEDSVAKDAGALLEDLARRGAAFGLHLLLSSQSPGGRVTYLRPIYEQMALRIALGCRQGPVSQAILGEGNESATRLTNPGEAIYNDRAGDRNSSPVIRIAELPNSDRQGWLEKVTVLKAGRSYPAPVTLDPAAPALLDRNPVYSGLISKDGWSAPVGTIEAWLGEPIEIKAPTTAIFERYLRSNLLIIGEESISYGLLVATILSVAGQRTPGEVSFTILDFARPSSPFKQVFGHLKAQLPHSINVVGPRAATAALDGELALLSERLEHPDDPSGDRFVVVVGFHRWQEAVTEGPYNQQSETGRRLGQLLEEGPESGCHSVLWCDNLGALDRAVKRSAVALFDQRVLLRVAEPESMALVGTPAASRLEDNRALFRDADWESGRTEKFKPYALASPAWIDSLPFQAWSSSNRPRNSDGEG